MATQKEMIDAILDKFGSDSKEAQAILKPDMVGASIRFSDITPPTPPSPARQACEEFFRRANTFRETIETGYEMRADLVLPNGERIVIAWLEPLTRETIQCTGVNHAGHRVEATVSVAQATLTLTEVPASEEYARQERVGFLARLSPPKSQPG